MARISSRHITQKRYTDIPDALVEEYGKYIQSIKGSARLKFKASEDTVLARHALLLASDKLDQPVEIRLRTRKVLEIWKKESNASSTAIELRRVVRDRTTELYGIQSRPRKSPGTRRKRSLRTKTAYLGRFAQAPVAVHDQTMGRYNIRVQKMEPTPKLRSMLLGKKKLRHPGHILIKPARDRMVNIWGLTAEQADDTLGAWHLQSTDLKSAISDVTSATDLLVRYLKSDRIHSVVRRRIPACGGVSLITMLKQGNTERLLKTCADMFRFERAT